MRKSRYSDAIWARSQVEISWHQVKVASATTAALSSIFFLERLFRTEYLKPTVQMVTATFKHAQACRKADEGLVFHSDRGLQYMSRAFRKVLNLHHAIQLLSDPGQPHDNAVAESFFASMKKEALYRKDCKYKTELLSTVKEYIRFYNNERPHTALGYKTPVQFEDQYFQGLSGEKLHIGGSKVAILEFWWKIFEVLNNQYCTKGQVRVLKNRMISSLFHMKTVDIEHGGFRYLPSFTSRSDTNARFKSGWVQNVEFCTHLAPACFIIWKLVRWLFNYNLVLICPRFMVQKQC